MKTCLSFAAAALVALGLSGSAKAQFGNFDGGGYNPVYAYYNQPLPRMPAGYTFSSYGYNPSAYGYNPNAYGYNPNAYYSPSAAQRNYYYDPGYQYQTYTYRYFR